MTATQTDVDLMLRIIRLVRSQGVKVRVIKGWRNRGRPYSWAQRGILEHHDASSSSSGNSGALGIIITGRSGIPGPLAQFQGERDGTLVIVAAGMANHAGYGGPWQGVPANQGNTYLYGMEIANNGINEPYSPELLKMIKVTEAAVLTVLADFRNHEPRIHMLGGHKEWTPRKIDPRADMNQRRRDVQRFIARLEGGVKKEEWDEMATPAQIREEVRGVVREEIQALLTQDLYPKQDRKLTVWKALQRAGNIRAIVRQELERHVTRDLYPRQKRKLTIWKALQRAGKEE